VFMHLQLESCSRRSKMWEEHIMADSATGVDAELLLDTEEPELMELMIKS